MVWRDLEVLLIGQCLLMTQNKCNFYGPGGRPGASTTSLSLDPACGSSTRKIGCTDQMFHNFFLSSSVSDGIMP
jgi:hypothetical protein